MEFGPLIEFSAKVVYYTNHCTATEDGYRRLKFRI